MLGVRYERGDTIIEVLLAFTVFSVVAVAAIAIMNQGTSTAQRSLEITQVRQQIDAQAEALRAAQQAAILGEDTAWQSVINGPDTGRFEGEQCPNPAGASDYFIMNPLTAETVRTGWFNTAEASTDKPYAHVDTEGGVQGYGMWIERLRTSGGAAPDAYNFTINACWYGAGSDMPMKLETSVRLYDPS